MTATSPKFSPVFAASIMLALAPAAALVFLWPAASAQVPAKTASAQVSIERVRLQDPDARRVAQVHIEAAARSVCAQIAIRSPLIPREQADCRRETVASAMEQLFEIGKGIVLASSD